MCSLINLCLRCQVPSREGLDEWDMLPIKFFFKVKVKGKSMCKFKTNTSGHKVMSHEVLYEWDVLPIKIFLKKEKKRKKVKVKGKNCRKKF